MLRTRTTRWTAATVALCLVMLAGAWFVLIGPRRAQAADLAARNVAAIDENDSLQLKIAQLKAQSAQLPDRLQELDSLLRQMPATADMPRLVQDLRAMAAATGVRLDSIVPSAAEYATAAPGSKAAAGSAGAPAKGLVKVPIRVVATGDYFQCTGFVQKLQTAMERALLIEGLQVSRVANDKGSGLVQLTFTGAVFVLPGVAVPTVLTPTAASTAAVSPTAASTSVVSPTAASTSVAPAAPSATGSPAATVTGGTR